MDYQIHNAYNAPTPQQLQTLSERPQYSLPVTRYKRRLSALPVNPPTSPPLTPTDTLDSESTAGEERHTNTMEKRKPEKPTYSSLASENVALRRELELAMSAMEEEESTYGRVARATGGGYDNARRHRANGSMRRHMPDHLTIPEEVEPSETSPKTATPRDDTTGQPTVEMQLQSIEQRTRLALEELAKERDEAQRSNDSLRDRLAALQTMLHTQQLETQQLQDTWQQQKRDVEDSRQELEEKMAWAEARWSGLVEGVGGNDEAQTQDWNHGENLPTIREDESNPLASAAHRARGHSRQWASIGSIVSLRSSVLDGATSGAMSLADERDSDFGGDVLSEGADDTPHRRRSSIPVLETVEAQAPDVGLSGHLQPTGRRVGKERLAKTVQYHRPTSSITLSEWDRNAMQRYFDTQAQEEGERRPARMELWQHRLRSSKSEPSFTAAPAFLDELNVSQPPAPPSLVPRDAKIRNQLPPLQFQPPPRTSSLRHSLHVDYDDEPWQTQHQTMDGPYYHTPQQYDSQIKPNLGYDEPETLFTKPHVLSTYTNTTPQQRTERTSSWVSNVLPPVLEEHEEVKPRGTLREASSYDRNQLRNTYLTQAEECQTLRKANSESTLPGSRDCHSPAPSGRFASPRSDSPHSLNPLRSHPIHGVHTGPEQRFVMLCKSNPTNKLTLFFPSRSPRQTATPTSVYHNSPTRSTSASTITASKHAKTLPQHQYQNPALDAVAVAMIGEWMWKHVGSKTHKPAERHKRWVWLSPSDRTLMWSAKPPNTNALYQGTKLARSRRKLAIRSVFDVMDDSLPPSAFAAGSLNVFDRAIVVVTPERSLKFTALSAQRHYLWLTALSVMAQNMHREAPDLDSLLPAKGRRGVNVSSPSRQAAGGGGVSAGRSVSSRAASAGGASGLLTTPQLRDHTASSTAFSNHELDDEPNGVTAETHRAPTHHHPFDHATTSIPSSSGDALATDEAPLAATTTSAITPPPPRSTLRSTRGSSNLLASATASSAPVSPTEVVATGALAVGGSPSWAETETETEVAARRGFVFPGGRRTDDEGMFAVEEEEEGERERERGRM